MENLFNKFSKVEVVTDEVEQETKDQFYKDEFGYSTGSPGNSGLSKTTMPYSSSVKGYQVDQLSQMKMELEKKDEIITRMTKELSVRNSELQEKKDVSKILQDLLPEHIYELVLKIKDESNSTFEDAVAKGLVLLGLALRAKEEGAEIVIIDNEGNILSKIEGLK